MSFDDGSMHEIAYEETAPLQIVRRFVTDRELFLEELFAEGAPEQSVLWRDTERVK